MRVLEKVNSSVYFFIGFLLFGGTNLIMSLSFFYLGYSYSNIFVVITKLLLLVCLIVNFNFVNINRGSVLYIFVSFWVFWFLRLLFYSAGAKGDLMLFSLNSYYLYAVFFSVVPFLLGNNRLLVQSKNISEFYRGTKLGLVLFCVTTLLLFYSKLESIARLGEEDHSVNPLAISYTATLLLGLLLWECFFKKVSIINVLLILLCIPLLGLGASKGSILAILLTLLIFLYLKKINYKVLFGSIIVFFIIAVNYKVFYLEPLVTRMQYSFDTNKGLYKEMRYYLWEYTIEKIMENPLLGYFSNIIANEYSQIKVSTFSHNIILESFFVLGILGGLMMIYFCISSFVKVIIMSKRHPSYSWVLPLFIISLSQNLVSGNIYSGAIWFWFFVGFVDNIYIKLNERKEK